MSRTTAKGATRYSTALTTKATAMACEVTAMNRLTKATAPTARNTSTTISRADSGVLAVRKVSHTVASWMASTTDWAQPATKETETRYVTTTRTRTRP